jgi:Ca2+-binding RTX toxin-like protein
MENSVKMSEFYLYDNKGSQRGIIDNGVLIKDFSYETLNLQNSTPDLIPLQLNLSEVRTIECRDDSKDFGVSVIDTDGNIINVGEQRLETLSETISSKVQAYDFSTYEDITGTAKDDLIYGDLGNDKLFGGKGNDQLFGGAGKDKLVGGKGNDVLYGELGDDKLKGGSGADFLEGDLGNDRLIGGRGDDSLDGGLGADLMTLGAGSDTVIVADADSGVTVATADVITDFTTTEDTLSLGVAGTVTNYTELDGSDAANAVTLFAAAETAANTALDGTVTYALVSDGLTALESWLFIDNDADGTADQTIVLTGLAVGGFEFGDIVA